MLIVVSASLVLRAETTFSFLVVLAPEFGKLVYSDMACWIVIQVGVKWLMKDVEPGRVRVWWGQFVDLSWALLCIGYGEPEMS
jgi:hypothetical protein